MHMQRIIMIVAVLAAVGIVSALAGEGACSVSPSWSSAAGISTRSAG